MRLLEEAGTEVVAAVGDGDALVDAVAAHRPDVAVVDVRMPPTHTDEGLRAALRVPRTQPRTGVLVLSQYVEGSYAEDLLATGGGVLVIGGGAVEKHIDSIFTELRLPPSPDDHRRVLAVVTWLTGRTG